MAKRDAVNYKGNTVQTVFQQAAGDTIADRIEALAIEVRGINSFGEAVLASPDTLCALATTLQATRRKIDQIFELQGFAVSPACDIMLELFQARVRGAPVPIATLFSALNCTPSTAVRWIDVLQQMQLLEQSCAHTGSEQLRVALTEKGYLRTAQVLQLHLQS